MPNQFDNRRKERKNQIFRKLMHGTILFLKLLDIEKLFLLKNIQKIIPNFQKSPLEKTVNKSPITIHAAKTIFPSSLEPKIKK